MTDIKKELKLSINLNNYKNQYNLSITRLCKTLKITYQMAKDILNGNQIGKVRTIEKIADNLGLTIDKLLFEEVNFE
ncbi:XRE family transcriptional regulator [Paraclostridium sordellii 8483]|uniref:helix-turn-helix domain-containing protein n=1 Tax=Paraclostridium sordellii TaxID=1505 RepID=UPI0002DA06BF|nr:helix-turn-helix transcriptional regulator [Paeniclostridium sordellii]TAN67672.1 XRE family transcriptional regulator [Paeniclostridium sordellii 8483]